MACGAHVFRYMESTASNYTDLRSQSGDVLPLVLYCFLSVLGTTFNIFHISALVIQEPLRHRTNVLLANQALANLLVSLVALPSLCIAILANQRSHRSVAVLNWCSSVLCFLVTSVNGVVHSLFTCCRYRPNGRIVGTVAVFAWLLSAFLIVLPPYCPKFHDHFYLLFLTPMFLSLLLFLGGVYRVRKQRPEVVNREEILQRQLVTSNMIAHSVLFCFWMPFIVALGVSAEPSVLHNLLTFAQLSCCVWALVYPATHPAFGQAFVHLTRYFCLKTHPEFSKTFQDKPPGMVRVHMMGMEARMHRSSDSRRDQDSREKPEEIFL